MLSKYKLWMYDCLHCEFDEEIEQADMSRTLHNVSSYTCRDRDTVAF